MTQTKTLHRDPAGGLDKQSRETTRAMRYGSRGRVLSGREIDRCWGEPRRDREPHIDKLLTPAKSLRRTPPSGRIAAPTDKQRSVPTAPRPRPAPATIRCVQKTIRHYWKRVIWVKLPDGRHAPRPSEGRRGGRRPTARLEREAIELGCGARPELEERGWGATASPADGLAGDRAAGHSSGADTRTTGPPPPGFDISLARFRTW